MKTIRLSKSVADTDREIFYRHVAACQKHQLTGSQEDLDEVLRTAEAVNTSHELLETMANANSAGGAIFMWILLLAGVVVIAGAIFL